ncbi:hypothetical protein TNCV_3514511 [Trichonephila clavipes]|nr:hypothetical protein TNCV_3514511 [Trichonephila clavipes]
MLQVYFYCPFSATEKLKKQSVINLQLICRRVGPWVAKWLQHWIPDRNAGVRCPKPPNTLRVHTKYRSLSWHYFPRWIPQFGFAIHQNDHQARRRFVEWTQNETAVVPDFHKRILFSDEAHFWLNGYVNKQNCRIWSEANPQVYVKTPLHPEKLTVWCALWAGGILLQKRGRPQRYSQW